MQVNMNTEMTKNSKLIAQMVNKKTRGISSSSFTIPELPTGEQLVFNLKSTWGDRHYIGLNGIEIFSSEGELVKIRKVGKKHILHVKFPPFLDHSRSS